MTTWVPVCPVGAIDEDDVIAFAHEGTDYAVYKTADGEVYASAGHCTHERTLLCEGLVMDGVVECPKHNGRFDVRTGRALGAPALVDLATYPVRVEGATVYLAVDG
jgi:3-phenylpropionate/trans-cinnamate dioxygenase ferredoxin subunit